MFSDIISVNTILFVENQKVSTDFYSNLFGITPDLEVEGMTEFKILDNFKIGLMPNKNISKILPEIILSSEITKCELYIYVSDIQQQYEKAIKVGAKLLSPIRKRNWGDLACYFSDPDNNVIAFAQKEITQ